MSTPILDEENDSNKRSTFTALKSRIIAAVLMSLLAATVTIPGMATYLPVHQNDQIGLPILFFPFIWTAMVIYCFLAKTALRVWGGLLAITLIHVLCVYLKLVGII